MQLGIKGMLILTTLLEKRSHSRSTFMIITSSGKPAKGLCHALLCVQRRPEEAPRGLCASIRWGRGLVVPPASTSQALGSSWRRLDSIFSGGLGGASPGYGNTAHSRDKPWPSATL